MCVWRFPKAHFAFQLFFFFLSWNVWLFPNSQISLFSNFFIKNGSHGIIHTFKNYFATVFSIFSFQQNKWYPNTPVHLECMFPMRSSVLLKNDGSCTLFTGPVSTFFSKKNFKTGSHGTIYTFKNYFAIVFWVFSNKRYPNRP